MQVRHAGKQGEWKKPEHLSNKGIGAVIYESKVRSYKHHR